MLGSNYRSWVATLLLKSGFFLQLDFWSTFPPRVREYPSLVNLVTHSGWKLPKMSHLSFSILVFSTIFCRIKIWHIWLQCLTENVEWDFLCDFQTLCCSWVLTDGKCMTALTLSSSWKILSRKLKNAARNFHVRLHRPCYKIDRKPSQP